ncbi:MAG TPA: ATP-binding cassette domain-containing protein [Terriglobales bacterium]|nr:ATP-binding cassette domain-containing protein [Terriglobales bacterium]
MSSDLNFFESKTPLLRVRGLSKCYFVRKTLWGKRALIPAAVDISFEISAGETLALVGSSGSGKSTVARCVTRLEKPDAGEIWLGDTDIVGRNTRELRPFRSHIQMVFQDPATAMNTRMSAAQIIEEPLLIRDRGRRADHRHHAAELMKEVGLSPDWLDRRISEFSGGQKQRIAIARALVLQPRLLVLDEALTGLDIRTLVQLIELLLEVQRKHALGYLLISHDLAVVRRSADRIAVISQGKIVEAGTASEILSNPAQPETQSLVAAGEHFRAALAKAHGASA